MILYHCSPAWLDTGSIIRPGNYGRIVYLFGERNKHWGREQVLESVRRDKFPEKPSRLSCAFACETMDAARFFKGNNCPAGIIYEVEPVSPEATAHVTDFNLVEPIPGKLESMEDVAQHYWSSSFWFTIEGYPDLKCAERLLECGLRIRRELE